jgi:predicted Zn-dependent protease
MTDVLTKFVLVLSLTLAAGCDTLLGWKDAAIRQTVSFIPRTVDRKMGELASQQAEAGLSAVPPAAQDHLQAIVEPLAKGVSFEGLKPTFRVLSSDLPNAFAYPDGSIFFTSKLLEIAQTPEEILSVAGHELAHVAQRHSMQQLVTRATFTVVLNFVVGDVAGLADLLNTGSSLLNLKFSRDHEREADVMGDQFLEKSKLPRHGAELFFKRMKEFESKRSAGMETTKYLSFLTTHPATEERMAWAATLPKGDNIKLPEEQKRAFENLKKLFSSRESKL